MKYLPVLHAGTCSGAHFTGPMSLWMGLIVMIAPEETLTYYLQNFMKYLAFYLIEYIKFC